MVAPLTDASPLLFSKLNLTCLSTGDPTPVTYWTKDGSPNVPRAKFSQDNATLTIDQVQLEDDGFYMCFVENRAGNTSSSAKVEVLGKATFFVLVVLTNLISLSIAVRISWKFCTDCFFNQYLFYFQ